MESTTRSIIAAAAISIGVLAPAGSSPASARHHPSFAGSCSVEGNVAFSPPVNYQSRPLSVAYDAVGTCSGMLGGRHIEEAPVRLHHTATTEGSCTEAHTTAPGHGVIAFGTKAEVPYGLEFAATGTEVDFNLTGRRSGLGSGHGTFLTARTPPDAAAQCAGDGAAELPMDMTLTTDSPFVSTRRASRAHRRSIGDVRPFAHVPYPGNPGGLAVDGRTLYVDNSANFDRPFEGRTSLFAYDLRTGGLRSQIDISEKPVTPMGLAGIALDASGRQYIADMNGRVVRIDPESGVSEVYATFPTSTDTSFSNMPTFDAFGPDGSLYVGDAAQPIIWRVPPGGGEAEMWFADPRLGGTYGGNVVGLALDPSGGDLYFAAGNQPQITVFRLPMAQPTASNLEVFHRYTDVVTQECPADPNDPNTPVAVPGCETLAAFGAGGMAFGASGRLYLDFVAKSQISILDPDGSERLRFPSPKENTELEVPVNGPFGLAFDGRGSLLIANAGDASLSNGPGGTPPPTGPPDSKSWAVLSAWVNDTAARLFRPDLP